MASTLIAIVEDDSQTRERIARLIDADSDLQLVLAAATAHEAIDYLAVQPLDVLLVDLGLPDLPGLEVILQCRRIQPACAVMVLSIFGDELHMLQAFEAGANGYLLKDGSEDVLAMHIRELRAGGSPLSPIIARQLLRRWQSDQTPSIPSVAPNAAMSRSVPKPRDGAPPRPESRTDAMLRPSSLGERLSPKEYDVLDLVSRGFTYQEVADRTHIAVSTVQTHIRNIYGKLDVHNKSEAIFEARQLGLLP
ncbi:response regulator transcription factor [Variovorax sp. J22R115]|uniref:response regulator transcription factor n=1 Tax=Variovorax sp. J22R115 TaxID=3053509 RepID=UPI0025758ED6|nr:response regulator transcription factor [Variovorax sp. J22R115]MDM0053025.1 response regulator transcription factor [Variovorax sp. J22R115]